MGRINPESASMPRSHAFILGIVAALILAGCASDFTASATQHNVLEPWTEITQGQADILAPGPSSTMNPPGSNFITLVRPAALSAQGNDIYIFDAGLGKIFRYDRDQQTLNPFATILPVQSGISIYAAPDSSIYYTDPAQGQVFHFARDGARLPPLISRGNLVRPVSVIMDESNGQVMVADGLYDQIVVFNSLGMVLNIIKPQHVLSIAAMVAGPGGIYVLDSLAKQVVALGWDGRFRYAFDTGSLSEPGSIAVYRDNLVFVSDNFKHVIKVYRVRKTRRLSHGSTGEGVQLVANVGGEGFAPDSFNGIAGLSVAGDYLFVADSLNARVPIMLINPSAMDVGKQK